MSKKTFFFSQIFLCIFSCLSATATSAQIAPDSTLDTQVDSNNNVFEIVGGQTRGNNLFHSFQDFSVPTGNEAFFNNADNIANIFSRVTGENISNINGLIRNNGSASLFLINPNGIIFGEGAQLDIGGSFLGSTADSILFDDGEFSATDIDSPPLLTINAPIGLDLADNPREIINRSTTQNSEGIPVGLEVSAGNNLSLVGGEINFEGGRVTAREGKIELGALSAAGTVEILEDGSLAFPNDVAQADITLRNGAAVNVRSIGGGDIIINAANLFTQGSFISAGIGQSPANNDARAGNIEINLTDNLNLDSTAITNIVGDAGVGDAGDISITTGSMKITNAGFISAGTRGQGNGGNVDIIARENVTLDGTSSSITSRVEPPNGVGNAGNVTLSTRNLNLINGGFIDAVTGGQGDAGNLEIASDNITITGGGEINASTFGRGNGGDIDIATGDLTLADGGSIEAITGGRGNGGDVKIVASDTILINTGSIDGDNFSASTSRNGIITRVQSQAVGNAGNVSITTSNLNLTNGATISASTFGRGDAGSIDVNANLITFEGVNLQSEPSTIGSRVEAGAVGDAGDAIVTTDNFNLINGGQINSGVEGQGNGGDIEITVNADLNIGFGEFDTGIFSVVGQGGAGNAGNIDIFTGNLTISDGGLVDTSTSGVGDAGSINIIANNNISIDGENLNSRGFTSRIGSRVNLGAEGNAKNVTIITDNLTLTNGGYLDASTFGLGNAGLIDVTAQDIVFNGLNLQVASSAFSQVNPDGEGNAGGVTINTGRLTLANGGNISTSTFGRGDAGNIDITADSISIDEQSLNGFSGSIISRVERGAIGAGGNVTVNTGNLTVAEAGFIDAITSGRGNAGNIEIFAENLELTDRGNISTSTFGRGNAGNIEIFASNFTLNGMGSEVSSAVEQEAVGNAGNINIEADSLRLNDRASINAITQSETSNNNGAANITLQIAENITLQNNSLISAQALNNANGGNVTINTEDGFVLAFPNQNNDIIANAQQGRGGNIKINTQAIFGIEERPLNNLTNDINASSEFGLSGTVEIKILETDPSQNSLDIPVETVNAEVARTCERNISGDRSEFVVTGRGGMPIDPEDNFRLPAIATAESVARANTFARSSEDSAQIVEASGWVRNAEGKILLVAAPATASSLDSPSNLISCN